MASSRALVHYKNLRACKETKAFLCDSQKEHVLHNHRKVKLRLQRRKKSQLYSRTKVTSKDITLLSNCPRAFPAHILRWCTMMYSENWGMNILVQKTQAEANIHTPPRILLAKAFLRMHVHESLSAQIVCKIFQKLNDESRKSPREVKPAKKRFELNSSRSKLKPDEGFNLVYSGCDCRCRTVCADYLMAV